MNLSVFLGAPGSGKGTQAKRLSEAKGFKHFSTGDMLRASIQQGSEVGKKAKQFIDKGELVPDGVMIELIENALKGLSADARVILDGFPRTVAQAKALDSNQSTSVKKALYFKIDEPILIERLTGRRICEKCGEPFHVKFMPPRQQGVCDKCGGKLMQRKDDSEDVVKRRLEIFRSQNDQLLDYYRDRSNLQELDADKAADAVQNDLVRLLN